MTIAVAHLEGDADRVDALARDHLAYHPDSVLVAWISADSHSEPLPERTPHESPSPRPCPASPHPPASRAHADRFRPWWQWLLTALAFPPAGLIAHLVAGRVDSVPAAVLNGVIAGAGIGAAQWALLRHREVALTWIPATAAGLGAGLAVGAALVSYRTDITSLALMGAISGLGVGIAQGVTLRQRQARARLERGHRGAVRPRMDRHHRGRHRRQPAMGRVRPLRVHHPRLPAEHRHRGLRSRREPVTS